MTFEEKVRSMSAQQIVQAMIDGLENPITKISMGTFGFVDSYGVCYGCAATNAIAKISDQKQFVGTGLCSGWDAQALNSGYMFLRRFECAIDNLRMGRIKQYNIIASENGFATLRKIPFTRLPRLSHSNLETQLNKYKQFARYQSKRPNDEIKPNWSVAMVLGKLRSLLP